MTLSVLSHRDELGVKPGRLFLDGDWREGSDGSTWTHVHPASNEEVTSFATATAMDVDTAVRAARRAFDDGSWTSWKAKERKQLLHLIETLNTIWGVT